MLFLDWLYLSLLYLSSYQLIIGNTCTLYSTANCGSSFHTMSPCASAAHEVLGISWVRHSALILVVITMQALLLTNQLFLSFFRSLYINDFLTCLSPFSTVYSYDFFFNYRVWLGWLKLFWLLLMEFYFSFAFLVYPFFLFYSLLVSFHDANSGSNFLKS